MTEQNSSDKFFNGEDLPIQLPPVDAAWQNMQQRLDAELPVVKHSPAHATGRVSLWKGIILAVTTATVIFAIVWYYMGQHSKNNPAPAASTYNDNNTITAPSPDTIFPRSDNSSQQAATTVTTSASSSQLSSSLQSSSTVIPDSKHPAEKVDQHSGTDHKELTEDQSAGNNTPKNGVDRAKQKTRNQQGEVVPNRPLNKKGNAFTSTELRLTDKQSAVPSEAIEDSTDRDRQLSESTTDAATPRRPVNEKADTQQAITHEQPNTEQAQQKTAYTDSPDNNSVLSGSKRTIANASFSGQFREEKNIQPAGMAQRFSLEPLPASDVQHNTRLEHSPPLLTIPAPARSKRGKAWAVSLQLNIPIPLSDDSSYFMGPDAKKQIYRRFIPSLRLERTLWKGAMSLEVSPYISSTPNSNQYKVGSGSGWGGVDTTRSLLKQSGWGLALVYQLPVYRNWHFSAGIQASFLQKAVIMQTLKDTSGRGQTSIYAAPVSERRDFATLRLNGMAELSYMAGNWQFGARTLLPLTPVSNKRDVKARPVQLEFVLRRRFRF